MAFHPSDSTHYLYRILRSQDTNIPSRGLCSTDPSANISIEEHVQRGNLHAKIRSQYISTTKSPQKVLSWLIKEGKKDFKRSIVIISVQRLRSGISLVDLSEGYPTLEPNYDKLVRKHQEVLVSPIVNADAIVGIVSYADIAGSWQSGVTAINAIIKRHLRTRLRRDETGHLRLLKRNTTNKASEKSYSTWSTIHCFFCSKRGHEQGDCLEFQEWDATQSAIDDYFSVVCEYCRDYGHEAADCERLATESAIDDFFSVVCEYCRDYGHEIADCERLATESAIDDFFSVVCEYCRDYGHEIADCERLATESAIDDFFSVVCEYCRDYGHEIADCERLATESAIDDFFSVVCEYCRDYGHEAADCERLATESAIDDFFSVVCEYCRNYGHEIAECPVAEEDDLLTDEEAEF